MDYTEHMKTLATEFALGVLRSGNRTFTSEQLIAEAEKIYKFLIKVR